MDVNKSVYSLVLMDDVVAEVDRLAYQMNTSRSNMINQILAEYVSYMTPEKRMREVFDRAINMLTGSGTFQLMLQPSDSTMSLRSALAYKYNPSVRYSVELYRDQQGAAGELKLLLRSQNNSLILYMNQFFKLWTRLEQAYVGETNYQIESGRYTRVLRLPKEAKSNEQMGEILAEYIQVLDECMKIFFELLDQPQAAAQRIETRYRKYLAGGNAIC